MNYLRIIAIVGWAAALVGAVVWIGKTLDKARQVDRYRACSVAAGKPAAPLATCDAAIEARVATARRSVACDAALVAKPVDLFGVNTACGAPIKAIFARVGAAEANAADLAAQLATASADRDAAVARAEARNRTTADRKSSNDRLIQTAPRTGDGRVRCDAQCLRDLASR